MQPERRKTALAFHAKDDHVAVRTRVLDVLAKQRFRFYAVVRDKQRVLADLMALQRVVSGTRYSEDALYDAMVGRLLRDRLHVDECEITFARRGASNRTAALYRAIEQAKENFRQRWRQPTERQHTVLAASPHQYGGLQAADYCLWALQRLLVRREDAAWSRLAPHVVEVVLMDEPAHQDGRVFTQSQPLELRHVK